MVPWFQAQNDMKTPLRVSVVTVMINATLNIMAVFLLPEEWRHVGLAWSTVVCALAGAAMLVTKARAKNGSTGLKAAIRPIAKMALSASGMAAAIIAAKPLAEGLAPVLRLAVLMTLGGAVYFALAALAMKAELKELKNLRRRR